MLLLALRPALWRLGIPLGVGMPVFSNVSRLPIGVETPLPSLLVSVSRRDMDSECEWPCPLMELLGLGIRGSAPLIDEDE
jgi:hypothetical protein